MRVALGVVGVVLVVVFVLAMRHRVMQGHGSAQERRQQQELQSEVAKTAARLRQLEKRKSGSAPSGPGVGKFSAP